MKRHDYNRQMVPKIVSMRSTDRDVHRNDNRNDFESSLKELAGSNDLINHVSETHRQTHSLSHQLPHPFRLKNDNRYEQKTKRKRKDATSQDHHIYVHQRESILEKENIPVQKVSGLHGHCDNHTKDKLKRNEILDGKAESTRRNPLCPSSSYDVNSKDANDRHDRDTACWEKCSEPQSEKDSSTSLLHREINGRVNPAIPTLDILNYPPDFDIFNNANVVFRPI